MEGGAHAAPTLIPEVVLSHVSVQPIEQSAVPVGTIEEAEREGLDPTVYATCAKPNKQTGIVGCQFYESCRVSAKGQSGPKCYGIEIIQGPAMGGTMTRNAVDCMWIASQVDNIEDNKGSIRVIAEEGETFDKVASVLIDNTTNEVSTNPFNANARREERVVPFKVPTWPRPGQNKLLLHDMLRAETMKQEKERRANENLTRNLGLGETIAPLDKRDADISRRGKAKG